MVSVKERLRSKVGEKEFNDITLLIDTSLTYNGPNKETRKKFYYELFLDLYEKDLLNKPINELMEGVNDLYVANYVASFSKEVFQKYRPKISGSISTFFLGGIDKSIPEDLDSILNVVEMEVIRKDRLSKKELKKISNYFDYLRDVLDSNKIFPDDIAFRRMYISLHHLTNGVPIGIDDELKFMKDKGIMDKLNEINNINLYNATIFLARAFTKDLFFDTGLSLRECEFNLKRMLGNLYNEHILDPIKNNPNIDTKDKIKDYLWLYLSLKYIYNYDKEMVDLALLEDLRHNDILTPNFIYFVAKSGMYKELNLFSSNFRPELIYSKLSALSDYVDRKMDMLNKMVKFESVDDMFDSLKKLVTPLFISVGTNFPIFVNSFLDELREHLSNKYKVEDEELIDVINNNTFMPNRNVEFDDQTKRILSNCYEYIDTKISRSIAEYLINIYSMVNGKVNKNHNTLFI